MLIQEGYHQKNRLSVESQLKRSSCQGGRRTALLRTVTFSILCFTVATHGNAASATEAESTANSVSKPKVTKQQKKAGHAVSKKQPDPKQSNQAAGAAGSTPMPPLTDAAAAAAMNPAARFDDLRIRGYNYPLPSYGDTLTQDIGGIRTTLASYGIGFFNSNTEIVANNMLNRPTSGPGPTNWDGTQSRQQYWGQRPSFDQFTNLNLTYDLRQYGVPDGQIQVVGNLTSTSWQHYTADRITLGALAWYQTFFDKALEVKVGYLSSGSEWVGVIIGGNFASPFGSNSFIPYEMGLAQAPATQPEARATWHIAGGLYDQFGIMRSLPINGRTGDVFYDDAHYNPSGFRFSVPNGRLLAVNELGYKTEAAPSAPATWLRFGTMYNTSQFANYQTGGTTSGVGSMYFLADRQLWQTAPDSPYTAYRGVYAGVSAMYAPPEYATFSQYYEGRVFIVGPFDSRPTDQLLISYNHQIFSRYLVGTVNSFSAVTGVSANKDSNTVTVAYTAHLIPGVYFTPAFSYTDRPSFTYTKGEGNDFSFLASVYTIF